jgi:hypothetical protein
LLACHITSGNYSQSRKNADYRGLFPHKTLPFLLPNDHKHLLFSTVAVLNFNLLQAGYQALAYNIAGKYLKKY